MGPAPAVAEIRRAVRAFLDGPVLVACSGGADSLALAAAVAFEAARTGVPAALATVDHGLQDGSAQQARRVAALAYELGFDPVETVRVQVATAGGPEAAAREARYAALEATADALGVRTVLLGHTLDDQAETVLLGLGRGSGPRSIAGMRARTGRYGRPLLGVRRETTEAACRSLGLDFWADPHNLDPSYQRVRLRTEVLPLLEEVLQGGVVAALARTASQLHDDQDALDTWAATLVPDPAPGREAVRAHHEVRAAELTGLPRAVRTRVLRSWALAAGAAGLTAVHLASLDRLVTDWHGQAGVDLPGGVRAYRRDGRLCAETREKDTRERQEPTEP